MFVIKEKFFVFSFITFIFKSQGLEKDALKEDIILVTDSVIKNATYKLFSELHLKKLSPKLKQSLLLHKFFITMTLKDHATLNLIVKLSRVNKNDVKNETDYFVAVINDILNEDRNDNALRANNEDITQHVDEFLTNLKELKESTGFNNDYESLEVKEEILKILRSHDPVDYNVSQVQSNKTTGTSSEDDSFLSENEFWVSEPERRIYQGIKTKAKYFPFMASIHIFKGFQCAGSIIKSDLIITAASCLQLAWNNRFFRENPSFLSARVGSNFYTGGGEDIPILEVYFHPEYNPKNLRNNLAVLRLLRHLKFRRRKRKVKKIEIDREESGLPMTTDGVTVVGWGARGTSNVVRDPWSNRLAYAVLDVYHPQECQKIYSREYVTRTNFCAGFISKGGGACNHDVGGPGVVNGILTGVISFGSPVCGAPDAPTVFTKVGYYADWIEGIMEQDVPRTKKRTTLRYTEAVTDYPTISPFLKTTYTMAPLGPTDTPDLFPQEDLRNLKEDSFKEFLSTMFESKELNDFSDLLNEETIDKLEDIDSQSFTDDTQEIQTDTKDKESIAKDEIKNKEEQESALEQPVLFTRMDAVETGTESLDNNMLKGIDYDEVIEKDIVRLIDTVDSSKSDEKSGSSSKENRGVDEIFTESKTEVLSSPLDENKSKIKEDEVITLLYLTENEKDESSDEIINVLEDSDDDYSGGMPIAEEGFTNLSLKDNTRPALDFMPRNVLYDLLSDAIVEVTRNKTM